MLLSIGLEGFCATSLPFCYQKYATLLLLPAFMLIAAVFDVHFNGFLSPAGHRDRVWVSEIGTSPYLGVDPVEIDPRDQTQGI